MRIQKLFASAALAFMLLAPAAAGGAGQEAEINWRSYQSGTRLIRAQNKKGFIHFYSQNCRYCSLMNRKTFSDKDVASYLNENFVPIRVNTEKQAGLAEEFGIMGVPSSWFIAEDLSNIGSRPGFIPAEMLLDMLRYVDTESFKKMSFQDFVDKSRQE